MGYKIEEGKYYLMPTSARDDEKKIFRSPWITVSKEEIAHTERIE